MTEIARKSIEARDRQQAVDAFKNHTITKESEGRWLLQGKDKDGTYTWNMAVEVIALEGKRLFVGGDIDDVVFAYGPRDPVQRVSWMGAHSSDMRYVAEKARIGSGHDFAEWDAVVAHEDLEELKEHVVDEEAYEEALEACDETEFFDLANTAFGPDGWELLQGIGSVLSSRIVHAHAAVERLHSLLEARGAYLVKTEASYE